MRLGGEFYVSLSNFHFSSGLVKHREHIFRDLRPYVCTYLDCQSADQLYDSYKDWASHELTSHCSIWPCKLHPELAFSTKSSLENHWFQEHMESDTSLDSKYAAWATQTISPTLDRFCPVCLYKAETLEVLQNHIATHLQRVAIFALPRSTDFEDASVEGDGSSRDANAEISDSSRIDLESVSSNHSSDDIRLGEEYGNSLTIASVEKLNENPELTATGQRLSQYVQDLHGDTASERISHDDHSVFEEVSQETWIIGKEKAFDLIRFEPSNRTINSIIELNRQGKYEIAETLLEASLNRNQKVFSLENLEAWKRMRGIIATLSAEDDHGQAERIARQLVTVYQIILGMEHAETLDAMRNVLVLLISQGKYDEAETISRHILKVHEQNSGIGHAETLKSMRHLIIPLIAQGKIDEAENIASQVLNAPKNLFGLEYPNTSIGVRQLLLTLKRTKR